MAYLLLALVVGIVCILTLAAARRGAPARGCCAPADPARDLRMRETWNEARPAE